MTATATAASSALREQATFDDTVLVTVYERFGTGQFTFGEAFPGATPPNGQAQQALARLFRSKQIEHASGNRMFYQVSSEGARRAVEQGADLGHVHLPIEDLRPGDRIYQQGDRLYTLNRVTSDGRLVTFGGHIEYTGHPLRVVPIWRSERLTAVQR